MMKTSEMGTTGLVDWIYEARKTPAKYWRERGQRKRRALAVIQSRYGSEGVRRFKIALANATENRAEKDWALM